jgi:hypothetical protein
MYVELRITADYGDKQGFVEKLSQEIGINAISAGAAVQKTVFQHDASTVTPKVVAAEQIQHKTVILYFLEGSDTIVVHVAARTVAETKQQAVRIARRTCALFEKPSVKTKTKAVIYAVNSQGFDTAIIVGNRIGRLRRFMDAFAERWLARIVTPGIVFGVATAFLPGTNLFQSALIGFLAAVVTLLFESIAFASTADDWKWEEIKNDD